MGWLDPWIRMGKRRGVDTYSQVGNILFPFLPTEGHAQLFWGVYERENVTFLRQWLRLGDVFLDLGANVGYLTAIAADAVGRTGEVHAFEPEPQHFGRLDLLTKLNPAFNIVANHCAVADAEGAIELRVSDHAGWHTILEEYNFPAARKGSVTVPMMSLDQYFERHSLYERAPVRLLKVDVEGAEALVVRGAAQVLERQAATAWLVEVTPPSAMHRVPPVKQLFSRFEGAGYRAFRRIGSFRRMGWRPLVAEEVVEQEDVLWMVAGAERDLTVA